MKKTLLAAVATTAFFSQAVEINPDQNGQVLLFPFYTVKNNFTTAVHLTNTTNKTKAVKVRFSEGKNTWEVLDFNLYLSPYDVWTATLSPTTTGGVILKTTDTSCSVPMIPSTGVEFRNVLYTGTDSTGNGQSEVDQSMTRLQEGHFEVIEMGEVLDIAPNNLATAIKHVNAVPNDCGALTTAWENGVWAVNRNTDMSAPTGGLRGIAYMIDVPNGYQVGYDATAIDNFWSLSGIGVSAHNRPGTSFPDLNGQVEDGASIVKLGNLTSRVVANNTLLTSTWTETIDALSAVLMSNVISNDYAVEPGLAGSTDWVMSFPTKHFYVNGTSSRNGLGPKRPPFTSEYSGTDDSGACEPITLRYYDREETGAATSGTIDFSPSATVGGGPQLCWETSRITFNNTKFFGEATTVSNIDVPYNTGWTSVALNGAMVSVEGHRFVGLPIVGFSTMGAKNGTLNGGSTLANYAAAFDHNRSRNITP